MPKVKGPLFSLEAHKALGKVLTYQRRPGGASVYPYKKPKVPLTTPQLWQRERISILVHWWQSLSDADKALWEAKAKGQGQSGYSYFISQQRNWMLDPSLALYLPLWSRSLKADSFNSKDSYAHSCAVTGAVWGSLGRLFAGAEYITIADHDILSPGNAVNDSPFSWGAWINMADATVFPLITKGTLAGREYSLQTDSDDKLLMQCFDVDNLNKLTAFSVDAMTGYEGSHIQVFATYDGIDKDGLILYVNGVAVASTNSKVGNYVAMHNYGDAVIGRFMTDSGTYAFGSVGEVFEVEGALTPQRIQSIYQATKWRYGV